MCAALTSQNTKQWSLFNPLGADKKWFKIYVVTAEYDNIESTFLCSSEGGIQFPLIDEDKWNILKEIDLAQIYFWQFDDYHREMCRLNLLYYTITLRNIPVLLINLLNPSSKVICEKKWSSVEGTNTRVKKFSIKYPDNYLINAKNYIIINTVYYFRNALYQSTCIDYLGCNKNNSGRYG